MDSLKTICFIECIKNEQIYNEFLNLPKYTQNVLSKDYIKFTNYYDIIRKYNLCKKYLNESKDYRYWLNIDKNTTTDNYVRNLYKLMTPYSHWKWNEISYFKNLTLALYEEFSSMICWDILFITDKIPKNKVSYLLKNYQRLIELSFIQGIKARIDDKEESCWILVIPPYIPNIIGKMKYFVETGILTFNNYDLLDHIENTNEIFIFEQLFQS